MTTRVVTYEDLDGNEKKETLMFHFNKMDRVRFAAKHPKLQEEMQYILDLAKKEDADSKEFVMSKMIDLVDDIVIAGYGIRIGDGFRKTPEVVQEFMDSEAHDAFVAEMLMNANLLEQFMMELFPDVDFSQVDGGTN